MVFQKLIKKGVGNLIALFCIILFIIYVIIIIIYDSNKKCEINAKGSYTYGIVNKINSGGRVGDSFKYSYYYMERRQVNGNFISSKYSRSHQIGDTIIIKFLPEAPNKSIIIEDVEYKSCMGLPPKEGWEKLPKCK